MSAKSFKILLADDEGELLELIRRRVQRQENPTAATPLR